MPSDFDMMVVVVDGASCRGETHLDIKVGSELDVFAKCNFPSQRASEHHISYSISPNLFHSNYFH